MKRKIILGFADEKGMKQYALSDNMRNILFFIALSILILLGSSIYGFIKYRSFANKAYSANSILAAQNKELFARFSEIKSKFDFASKELKDSEEKVVDLQLQVGFEENKNTNDLKQESATNVYANDDVRKKLLTFIPNGSPIALASEITSRFGDRVHPLSKIQQFHQGTDIRAAMNTPVRATADGIIMYSGSTFTGYGKLVIVSHNWGFETRYAHLNDADIFRAGEFVKKGDIIGYSGNSGVSTAPHIHYEVRFLGRALDGANFMKWNESDFSYIIFAERRVPWRSLITVLN